MNNKKKNALVPRLRFPEFISTGEWKICTLNKLARRINTRNQDNAIKRVLTNSAMNGVVDQSDYFDREVANQNNLENYFIIDEGDYVYNPRISATAPVGPISKNKVGKGVMSPLYTVFRFKNLKNDFYEQYFKTSLWHRYLKNVSNTGARHDRMSISNGSFMRMPLPYHTEKEQQKIADCLSSLDELIDAEGRKLAFLKSHKKGLMQKLFPAEGNTMPEQRFPEFQNGKKWNVDSVSKIISTIAPPKKIPSSGYHVNGKFPIIDQGQELICGWTNDADAVMQPKSKLLIFGDHTCTLKLIDRPFAQGADGIKILLTDKKIDADFLFHYLSFHSIKSDSYKRHFSELKEKTILFPSIESGEQQKIAACLSSVDELIHAQAEKMNALKEHKKGLMQGLFPSIEAVSE